MGIGMRIKEAAQARGITLRKLAEYAGISYNTLYSITKRDSERVDPETVKRIADALHVTIPYFYGMDDINALDIDEALKRGDQPCPPLPCPHLSLLHSQLSFPGPK